MNGYDEKASPQQRRRHKKGVNSVLEIDLRRVGNIVVKNGSLTILIVSILPYRTKSGDYKASNVRIFRPRGGIRSKGVTRAIPSFNLRKTDPDGEPSDFDTSTQTTCIELEPVQEQ